MSRLQMRSPTFVDVFCGCGGFTTGLVKAGWTHLVGIELDAQAAASYSANHHGNVLVKDVKSVTLEDLQKYGADVGCVDVLVGSPPCQSFSYMGKRSVNDKRDDLFLEMMRLADMLKPKMILMENVVGLLTKTYETGEKIIDRMSLELCKRGYHMRYQVLNAVHYNVPQNRKRVIMVAVQGEKSHQETLSYFPAPVSGPDDAAITHVSSVLLQPSEVGEEYRIQGKRKALYDRKIKEYGRNVFVRFTDPHKPSRTIRACYYVNRGAESLIEEGPDNWRMFTETEVARIQTFPDTYIFCGSKVSVYRQIGNAVPVNLAYRVGLAAKALV